MCRNASNFFAHVHFLGFFLDDRVITKQPVDFYTLLGEGQEADVDDYNYETMVFTCSFEKISGGLVPVIVWEVFNPSTSQTTIVEPFEFTGGQYVSFQRDHQGVFQLFFPGDGMVGDLDKDYNDNGTQVRCVVYHPKQPLDEPGIASDWATGYTIGEGNCVAKMIQWLIIT